MNINKSLQLFSFMDNGHMVTGKYIMAHGRVIGVTNISGQTTMTNDQILDKVKHNLNTT